MMAFVIHNCIFSVFFLRFIFCSFIYDLFRHLIGSIDVNKSIESIATRAWSDEKLNMKTKIKIMHEEGERKSAKRSAY